eukprot:990097-Prymnesium_polylepis.1
MVRHPAMPMHPRPPPITAHNSRHARCPLPHPFSRRPSHCPAPDRLPHPSMPPPSPPPPSPPPQPPRQ